MIKESGEPTPTLFMMEDNTYDMPDCPNCGDEITSTQNFCRGCGTDVSDYNEESDGSSSRSANMAISQDEDTSTQTSKEPSTTDNHISDNHGGYVTQERVAKIEDILDEGEAVHYLTRGSTVDVEGSSAGHSLFGDDRSRKTGTRGYVRAAITDKRVVVKIPQWLGSDERSVPYQNITSVDLDTGFVTKRLSLQTPGQTYHIEAHEPDKEEVREMVKFIREMISETNTDQVVVEGNQEVDPTEQLRNLKELHDDGVLTDEEFEEKKQSLLDKL